MINFIKKIISKTGLTVLRGDLKKTIREQPYTLELPAHLLTNSRIAASRWDLLNYLPKGGTVVEVGVGYGDFTRAILDRLQPEKFIAIDFFGITPGDEPWTRKTLEENKETHYDHYCRLFSESIQKGQMTVKKGLSWEKLAELPDNAVDYMYVDADHSYESVVKDIEALLPKMKSSGLIQFNDYTHFDRYALIPYGVPNAVHEMMINHQFEMIWLCLHPMGFYDVVLKKVPEVPKVPKVPEVSVEC